RHHQPRRRQPRRRGGGVRLPARRRRPACFPARLLGAGQDAHRAAGLDALLYPGPVVDGPAPEPALAALRTLIGSLENAERRLHDALGRARELDRLRTQGYSWRDIISTEPRPLVVTVVGHTV